MLRGQGPLGPSPLDRCSYPPLPSSSASERFEAGVHPTSALTGGGGEGAAHPTSAPTDGGGEGDTAPGFASQRNLQTGGGVLTTPSLWRRLTKRPHPTNSPGGLVPPGVAGRGGARALMVGFLFFFSNRWLWGGGVAMPPLPLGTPLCDRSAKSGGSMAQRLAPATRQRLSEQTKGVGVGMGRFRTGKGQGGGFSDPPLTPLLPVSPQQPWRDLAAEPLPPLLLS